MLGQFVDGRNDGMPAFTVNSVGTGRAYYLATVPDDDDGARQVTERIFRDAGVTPVFGGLPESIEPVRRGDVLTC